MSQDLESSFVGMLLADVAIALQRYRQSSSQAEMRNLVRTSFAAAEGLVWVFREHIVDVATSTYGLDLDEQHALAEISYSVSEQGRIYTQPRFIPLLAVLRLVARLGEKLAPDAAIDFSGTDWASFKSAVGIRNRITHPKSRADLILTQEDVATCLDALFWLLNQSQTVMAATNRAARVYLGQFDEVLRSLRSGDPATVALYNRLAEFQSGKGT